jgi:hypothetical protein
MRTPDEYRKFAAECERIAKEGLKANRKVLLEIAKAWRQCADEAERQIAQRPRPAAKRSGSSGAAETQEPNS